MPPETAKRAGLRQITTTAGRTQGLAPRVDDHREGCKFASRRSCRRTCRSPKVTEVLPILYLRGMSTSDFAPALAGFWPQGKE